VIQNSLQRIFDGMVSSLTETVMPQLDDPYARYQLQTMLDLLMNVAERVEWRCADLRREIDAVEPPLRQALATDIPPELRGRLNALRFRVGEMTNEQLTELCREHLDALAAVQRATGPAAPGDEPAELLARQIAAAALQTHGDEFDTMRRAHVRLAALTRPSRPTPAPRE
jgi:hypothetical protein